MGEQDEKSGVGEDTAQQSNMRSLKLKSRQDSMVKQGEKSGAGDERAGWSMGGELLLHGAPVLTEAEDVLQEVLHHKQFFFVCVTQW